MSEKDFLTYKGHPLVRCGDTIYYGSMADQYVIMLQIKSTKKVDGVDVADDVQVFLLNTDSDIDPIEKVVKKSRKNGLYNAMDIGAIWLERALSNK